MFNDNKTTAVIHDAERFKTAISVTLSEDDSKVTAIVCLIIEEESNRVRNVIVRAEKEVNGLMKVTNYGTKCILSCDLRCSASEICESKCWHTNLMHTNEQLMVVLREVVETSFVAGESKYFGDHVMKDSASDGSSNKRRENGQIKVQLDEVGRAEMICRGNRVARKLGVWCV